MFTGSIVALVTPMDDKGNVDRASLRKLVDYHVASGTSAIVAVGTTGESATLSHDEHVNVVLQTLELADGRIPVIAGAGANATAEAIALTECFNHCGVVGCLSVTPYYNKPTQEGLYQHFRAIASVPICRRFCITCRRAPVAICCQRPWHVWRRLTILSRSKKRPGT